MRLAHNLLAGSVLAVLVVGGCSHIPSASAGADPQQSAAAQQPKGAVLRWQSRKSDDGTIPQGALYREAVALQQRLASMPLASTGPANWTLLGPGNIGGRIRSILIHPTNPSIMWVGSVGGGAWKSTNAGSSWTMLPDLPSILAITCMVLDPVNPDTLYAGTGEQCFFFAVEGSSNSAVAEGAGVFKSTDGGNSWTQLPGTAGLAWNAVSRLTIDRNNPSILLASTISGVWRSTNGGTTWSQRTTIKALDVNIDPNNSSNYVAGLANGTSLYSTDGGLTWTPAPPFPNATRIELTYSKSTPGVVYAAVNALGSLTVWRSANGGQGFVRQSGNVVTVLENYTGALWVDPTNANTVVAGGLDLYRSTNAGVTFTKISNWSSYPGNSAHADHHLILEHPQFNGTTNNTVYTGNDGGIQRATNIYTVANLSGWTNLNNDMAITQLYGCCMSPTSGTVLGGAQDNGTVRATATTGLNSWTSPLGGDGSFCAADPNDPNYFYLQYYYLAMFRSSNAGASSGTNIKGAINEPSANFMAYIHLDPNDSNRMYACGAQLWRTNNVKTGSPPAWTSIKPALACPGAAPPGPKPAHFSDNPPCNVSTVAVARGNSNIVWVGHNNGSVFYSTNALAAAPTWIKVDDNSPALPDRWVSRIAIDKDNPSRVTVSFMGFTQNNVWRTNDSGATWSPRWGFGANILPPVPVSCIVQHRAIGGRYYAATDLGLYYSEDDAQTWQPAVGGPTIVSMDELVWRNDRTLVVATHGRSIWTCDVDPAAVTPVGAGCGVTTPPSLAVTAPVIGASQTYTLTSSTNSAPVALLLSFGPPVPTPIGPCVIQPALNGMVSLSIGATDGSGGLVTNLPLPGNASLAGAVLTAQEFLVVLGGPLLGVGELTNGVRMTFGF